MRPHIVLVSLFGCLLTGTVLAEPWYPVKCPSGYSIVKKGGAGHKYHCRRTVTSGQEGAYIYKKGACPMFSQGGPCVLGTLPNKPGKIVCVSQLVKNIPCSPLTYTCPPGYLLNTSGKTLAKDCSTKRVGRFSWNKTCYKKTARTSSKETDYKKPDF